jgi:NAD(P)-dependent dehydrogenase (short-subunit alcohol dehydrogenase family)
MTTSSLRTTAFVSGAASGIGRALALALARDGYSLALNDVSAQPLADCVREVLSAGAREAVGYTADVSDRAAIQAAMDDFTARFGSFGKVFANAGIGFVGVPFGKMTEKDWNWLLSVNVMGAVNVVSAALPSMIADGGSGQIGITASLAGIHVPAGWHISAYAATKSALSFLAQGIADETADTSISVSVVYPGFVATDIESNFRQQRSTLTGMDDVTMPDGLDVAVSMTAAEAARIIIAGMDRGIAHIFTHPDHSREQLDARNDALAAGIEASRALIASIPSSSAPASG